VTKNVKSVLLLLLLSIFASQTGLAAPAKTSQFKITLASIELIENNHVGNEWYTSAEVNGKELREGSSVTLKLKSSESIKLKAYAEEQDKIPDVGTASLSLKASTIAKTTTKSLKVTVKENRGRYSGNTSEWKFTFKVQKS